MSQPPSAQSERYSQLCDLLALPPNAGMEQIFARQDEISNSPTISDAGKARKTELVGEYINIGGAGLRPVRKAHPPGQMNPLKRKKVADNLPRKAAWQLGNERNEEKKLFPLQAKGNREVRARQLGQGQNEEKKLFPLQAKGNREVRARQLGQGQNEEKKLFPLQAKGNREVRARQLGQGQNEEKEQPPPQVKEDKVVQSRQPQDLQEQSEDPPVVETEYEIFERLALRTKHPVKKPNENEFFIPILPQRSGAAVVEWGDVKVKNEDVHMLFYGTYKLQADIREFFRENHTYQEAKDQGAFDKREDLPALHEDMKDYEKQAVYRRLNWMKGQCYPETDPRVIKARGIVAAIELKRHQKDYYTYLVGRLQPPKPDCSENSMRNGGAQQPAM